MLCLNCLTFETERLCGKQPPRLIFSIRALCSKTSTSWPHGCSRCSGVIEMLMTRAARVEDIHEDVRRSPWSALAPERLAAKSTTDISEVTARLFYGSTLTSGYLRLAAPAESHFSTARSSAGAAGGSEICHRRQTCSCIMSTHAVGLFLGVRAQNACKQARPLIQRRPIPGCFTGYHAAGRISAKPPWLLSNRTC